MSIKMVHVKSSPYLRDPGHIKKPPFERTRKHRKALKEEENEEEQNTNKWIKKLYPVLYIFHPLSIVLMIMVVLLAWNFNQLIYSGGFSGSSSRDVVPDRPVERTTSRAVLEHNRAKLSSKSHWKSSKIHSAFYEMKNITAHSRAKRHASGSVSHAKPKNEPEDEEEEEQVPKIKRRIPLTCLDDMLLDAEMPVSPGICLPSKNVKLLEIQEAKSRNTREFLREHLEECTESDDCLQLSPYNWKTEGQDEPCRKRTFLTCNITAQKCICQDRFDLRWDTEVEQSTYQWNPITKTCYVRASNPCKMEVPCAPGTTCRATVSISFNVPPLERICDCTDINMLIKAVNPDWWYCAEFWQKNWYFDLDNINHWEHPPYHIYARMKLEENKNATETEANYRK